MPYMDKYGRKTITVLGELGLGVCACFLGLFLEFTSINIILVVLMEAYLIIFGVSIESFVWIFCSEVL